jgi:phosphate uptake regulator
MFTYFVKRKVNLVGQNTLTVSLPSRWVEINNIQKGDELEILELDKELRMSVTSIKEDREISFNIEQASQLMNRNTFGPYLRGYDSITYKYSDPVVYTKLLNSIKKMVGFEIVEQTKQRCRLEEVSEGTEQNFSKLLMRLLFILKSYLEAVHEYMKNPKKDFTGFAELQLESDKISLYCRRLINKNYLHKPVFDTTAFYFVLTAAEQVGDELEDIMDYYTKGMLTNYKYDPTLGPMFDDLDKSLEFIFKKTENYLGNKNDAKSMECDVELKRLREDTKKRYREVFGKKHTEVIALHILTCTNLIKHMSEELF